MLKLESHQTGGHAASLCALSSKSMYARRFRLACAIFLNEPQEKKLWKKLRVFTKVHTVTRLKRSRGYSCTCTPPLVSLLSICATLGEVGTAVDCQFGVRSQQESRKPVVLSVTDL